MSAAQAYRAGTLVFWLALTALWWTAPPPGEVPGTPAAEAPPSQATIGFTLAEVSAHARVDDCWMAIDGEVYDITAYLDRHPTEPEVLLPWCGREATEAYRTKMRGRPHSSRADGLLAQYRIGTLRATARGP